MLDLFFGLIVLSSFIDNNCNYSYSSYSLVQSVLKLSGGQQTTLLKSNRTISVLQLEMLKKHFPDWEERMNYQKKQEKNYRSGLARIMQAKRIRVKFKLTKEEEDAFDYFNGKNFYDYHQSIETPPNIYDTRRSFLLKIQQNKNMRENFLKAYNQRKSEN